MNPDRIQGGWPQRRRIAFAAALVVGLVAPAGASAGFLSSTGPVIAIMGGELFVGEAEGHLSGAGTIAIHSQKTPSLACAGDFTSSAALGGSGQLHCSDGTVARFRFTRLSIFNGHGSGSFSRGPMSFAYGLSPEQAAPYLTLPDGKKLVRDGTELALVDR